MGQPIEHGGGHFGVAEDLRPIGEGEVRRDDDRGVFVELADEMEQQLRAGLAERQIAEFVDDDEVVTQQGLDDAAAPSGGLFLFELIDEIDEIEEAAARSGADDRGGDRDRQVGLSRTGQTNVILPGVRRLKSGSRTGFIRVWVILSRWSASGGMQAPITSLCGSPIAPWRCCRPG